MWTLSTPVLMATTVAHLEAADARSWKKVLEQASKGSNPYLEKLSEEEYFAKGRRLQSERVRELEKKGVTKLEVEERFKRAGMTLEYEGGYSILSAEAHNNISFIINRYFDLRPSQPVLRHQGEISPEQHRLDKACTFNITEIVLMSAERVLRLCGHGVAVLSPANSEFDRIMARISAPRPDCC